MSLNFTSSSPAGRYDYHVHPNYSIDAEGSVDEYCRLALQRGLDEICFTTHIDSEPDAPAEDCVVRVREGLLPIDGPWAEQYLTDITDAATKYTPRGLRVKAGLEVGFHDGVVDKVGRIIESYPFDFVLGSVHMVGAYSMAYRAHVDEAFSVDGVKAILLDYFGRVGRAARCGLFDCLAHLDLYRRTLGAKAEPELADGAIAEAARRSLAMAAGAGVGIEINSRNVPPLGPEYLSPGPMLLRMAASAGITVITTGSDAHCPDGVGAGIDEAREAVAQAGFSHIATFDRRRAYLHPVEAVPSADHPAGS